MITKVTALAKTKLPILVAIMRSAREAVKHWPSQGKVQRLLMDKKDLLIEVGAGDRKGANGWTTIDVTGACDIYWDLRRGIPFPDATVSKIYSFHFLEHLSFAEGQLFLDDCLRALKRGGIFSISVPNARIYIDAYVKPDSFDKERFCVHAPAYNGTTRIDYVNYMAYMNGHHKHMFDEESLLCILEKKGFRNARLRSFDPNLDRKERDYESIYAEAEKP